MIELYYFPTPNANKVAIFLEEAGLRYNLRHVDLWKKAQFEPEFLKLSPNGRIPAIVDTEPLDGAAPISVFESAAILTYLGEKTGRFLSKDVRVRTETFEWLFWQMAGLGPMAGQNVHFNAYAPDKIAYAIERYGKETARLFKVLDTRLRDRAFITGDYSIADMASYPWIDLHEKLGMQIDEYPDLKRWHQSIQMRPAVQAAYAATKPVEAKAA
jgi:GST-like protein